MPATQSPTVSSQVLSSRKAGSMTSRTLRITTTIIIIQSLLFFPAPVSRAQDSPTEAEVEQAKEAADLFMKLLEETGDFTYVIDEMYAGDFIERFLQEQIRDGAESNSPYDIYFATGITYNRDLLRQATVEDWYRLYIATNNFYYHVFVIVLNKSAEDILNDREPDDEMFDSLIPPKLVTLFNNHPVLKDFFDIDEDDKLNSIEPEGEAKSDEVEKKQEPQGDAAEKKEEQPSDAAEKKSGPKPIETPEEMRSVTETFQEGLRLLHEEYGDRLTDLAKKAIETKKLAERMAPSVHVSDKECLGFPTGVRHLDVQTPIMFNLTLGEIDGKQQIVWANVFAGD
jgi:hypothetical protein